MRILLDTHTLLWWLTDDARLSGNAREAIGDMRNEVFVSAASAWEVATKQRLGKLDGLPPVAGWFGELTAADGFVHLSITVRHALHAGGYDVPHRDPFDRMLIAQGLAEGLTLISNETQFDAYSVMRLW